MRVGVGDADVSRELREAEVEEANAAAVSVVDHPDVGRLDVSMHDAVRMRDVERLDERLGELAELVGRQLLAVLLAVLEPIEEIAAVEELHDEAARAVGIDDLMKDAHRRGALQRRHRERLAIHAFDL